MGLSCRRFFIAGDGALYRISNAKFQRMMQHPEMELVPLFAGQRIRSAELMIELFDREPYSVCRETFSIFQFDSSGCADMSRYDKQQSALVNVMLDPVFGSKQPATKVLDATDKFVAHGGTWSPTLSLKNQLENVALGLQECPTL
jgi:hypothetical protein